MLFSISISDEIGEVVKIEKVLSLPDKSIRRCELVPRHVVFSDDTIWNYERTDAFVMAPEQENLSSWDVELKDECGNDCHIGD